MAHGGAAIAVDEIKTATPSQGVDPMAIRWALNPIVRHKILEGQRIKPPIIPYGRWFPLQHFNTPEEIHSTDEAMARERIITRTALEVQTYLEEALAGKDEFGSIDVRKKNWGCQIGFFGEMDADKMAVVSKVLLPSLPEIRTICKEYGLTCPIALVCEGQDATDFDDRETCATCWLHWIRSDACASYAEIVSEEGRNVYSLDNPNEQRLVRPSIHDFETARNSTIVSLQVGISTLQTEWGNIVAEIDKGERKGFDEAGEQQSMRKDLHQVKPADKQLQMVREYGKAAGGGGNDALLEQLVKSQIQMSQALASIVGSPMEPAELTPAQQRMANARAAKAAKQEQGND